VVVALPPDREDDSWILWRDGCQYGPYSWEQLWRIGEDGNLFADDLIWSAALGDWTLAASIGSLTTLPPPAEPPARANPPRRRSRIPLALALLLLVVAGGAALAWYLMRRPATEIADYYPKEGPAGSFVILEVSKPIAADRVGIRYGDTPLSVTSLTDRCLGVRIPLDKPSGSLRLIDRGRELDSVPFAVKLPKTTPLLRATVAPSPNGRIVLSDAGLSVMIPGGLVKEPRTLSIARVENAAVYGDNPFQPIDVVDVSIEGMEQLNDFVEIGIPYDPAKLDTSIPVEANFAPVRWDEKRKAWVDLYYRVDESKNTVYFVTDHLSAFWTGFSVVGLGKTAAIVGVVGGAISEVAERWANDKYVSRNHKIRILYSDRGLRKIFPDAQWKTAIAPASLHSTDRYDPKYSYAVQDIAHIFEQSLARYVDAGFPDPTRKGIGGLHIYTRYVKVKVDSLYNYYAQQGEMAHETFWDTIHLPSEILKLEFFDPASGGRGTFEEHFSTFKALQAHELFHVIQRPYYGIMIAFTGTPHKWWRETTAEWAAHDLAKIPNRSGWEKDSPSIVQRIGPKFLQVPLNATGKIPGTCSLVGGLDHEYLAPVFVRYLVDEKGFRFKELVDAVATDPGSDPLVPLRKRLERSTGLAIDDLYSDFSIWLIRKSELQLSSFADPTNANVAAIRSDTVNIDEAETVLRVYQTDAGQEDPTRVTVFRTEEGRERLTMQDTPVLVMDESHPENYELMGSDGDILYFVAANGSASDTSVGLTIERMKDEKWESVGYSTMKVGRDGTASIWAVKISSGGLKIDPEKLDDAKGYEKYEFEVKASGLSPEITEVTFEWDFGDNRKASKGKETAKVADREAGITLEHVYEPSPNLPKDDSPRKYLLNVKLVRGGKAISSAVAEVTVAKAEVVAMPRRLTGAPGGGFDFDAAARPPGKYRFVWKWPGQATPLQTEGASSKASISLADAGEHPVTVELYDVNGALLAQDVVVAAVESEASAEPVSPPTRASAGRWTLTRQWSASWKDTRNPNAKVDAKVSNGSATINLSVPTSILKNGQYVTVMEPFSYSFSWTPMPASLGAEENREIKVGIDSVKTPTTGYNWSADIGFYNGWYEMNGEPPPEPGWIGHLRAGGASWQGVVSLSDGEEASTRPRSATAMLALWSNPKAGDQEVVTLRVFGQGINLRGATAVYLYHEYTWQQ
jgi:hypothetical protein